VALGWSTGSTDQIGATTPKVLTRFQLVLGTCHFQAASDVTYAPNKNLILGVFNGAVTEKNNLEES
jgi:hypothetical protein